MTHPLSRSIRWPAAALIALAVVVPSAFAQQGGGGPGGGGGQGGLSPDTPVLAPTPPGASTQGSTGPKTPLPPRDTPRSPQPGQSAGGDGPKTPLPPRDTPRAQQPGQRTAVAPDPDWPCVQVKVPTLSYDQMWSGPPLDDALRTWREDEKIVDLVGVLVARRTTMEEARARIDEFAAGAGDKRDAALTRLFAGVFEELNAQRSRIMAGIERYSQKQRQLSEKIKAESLKIAADQKDMAAQNTPEALQQQEALNWDTRIYDERTQSLTYVCESPVILEQRTFDLGRGIQANLSQASQ